MSSANRMTYPDDPSFDSPQADAKLEMSQEEVDNIIRNKRKARDPKACYACHRRKVKCDRGLPCDSCVKRDHPELCSYERPSKRRRIALANPTTSFDQPGHSDGAQNSQQQSGSNVTVPKEQWDRINKELHVLRETVHGTRMDMDGGTIDGSLDHDEMDGGIQAASDENESEREGIHAPSDQMGTMHLGSRSVLAYMVGLGRSKSTQNAAKTLLEENILPKLGLDNENATYPFVDLWSTDNSMQDVNGLCKALPDDSLCKEFFYAYRDVACTIYPVVADAVNFEASLNFLLANRARTRGDMHLIDPDKPYGMSISWLALLFAVLASGAQSAKRPAKERELTSQVYICCSYQALRMANFLTHPSLEAIQAFLVIGNVLSYNMNPGVSYIFLGLTTRMAFSIGLQADSQKFSSAEQYLRGRIWWALAWQDSHFAVSYDRPTASALCCPSIPYRKSSTPGHRSYPESMFRIIRLTQEIIRERTLNPRVTMTWATIQNYKDEVARIQADAASHLRDRSKCLVTTQHLERLALKLHCSYITSELCRPALKEPTGSSNLFEASHAKNSAATRSPTLETVRRRPSHPSHSPTSASSNTFDPNLPIQLRRECIINLQRTIEAYVELHSLSEFAARSWIGIQRTVSAAFLLGTLQETNQDPHIQSLLQKLEQVIAQRTMEDPEFADIVPPGSPVTARRKSSTDRVPLADSPHWAISMTKSLKALGKMNKALVAGPQTHPVQPEETNTTNNYQRQLPSIVMNRPYTTPMEGFTPAPTPVSIAGGLAMPAYVPIANLKTESFSPGAGLAGGTTGLSAITPDSTSSGSEWNYGNMTEMALEFVQPALWG